MKGSVDYASTVRCVVGLLPYTHFAIEMSTNRSSSVKGIWCVSTIPRLKRWTSATFKSASSSARSKSNVSLVGMMNTAIRGPNGATQHESIALACVSHHCFTQLIISLSSSNQSSIPMCSPQASITCRPVRMNRSSSLGCRTTCRSASCAAAIFMGSALFFVVSPTLAPR